MLNNLQEVWLAQDPDFKQALIIKGE